MRSLRRYFLPRVHFVVHQMSGQFGAELMKSGSFSRNKLVLSYVDERSRPTSE